MKKINFSMKSKSLFFMLFLILILLLTLYYQNKHSNKTYLYLLNNNYKKTIDNFYTIFIHKLKNSYENITISLDNEKIDEVLDEEALELENYSKSIYKKYKKNNPFLEKVSILRIKQHEIIFPKYELTSKNKQVFIKLSFLLKSKKSNFAKIEYLLSSKLLLKSVKMYNNSDGIIYFEDKNKNLVENYLEESFFNKNFSLLLDNCRAEKKVLRKMNGKFYIAKILKLSDVSEENSPSAVFFLDVSKEKEEYLSLIKNSIIVSMILFIFAAIIVNFYFTYLVNRISKNEKDLKQINKNLEKTISKEITKRLKIQECALKEKHTNEQILIQQSKLAMMGEMIGNIAHQWRQPLMQLSAIFMYLDAYNEKGKLTKEKFDKKIKDSATLIEYMSKTIEDFRNYFKPEKQKEEFLIKDCLDSALFIIDSALKSSFIELNIIYKNENIKATSFKNEFSQVLLNIISNAKDVLIQREIKNPAISIIISTNNNKTCICIEDNAQGIEEDIINKIFDPYFTTKHKSQGTGIGLYMSKMIIENNMNGKIFVENTENGAKFIIEI